MKKTDKKIENCLREVLTEVCEVALDEVVGFKWLTHFANYRYFPDSLLVVCVFETNNDLSNANDVNKDVFLRSLIKEKLSMAGINIKDMCQHVNFDTEEACEIENEGRWHERFG